MKNRISLLIFGILFILAAIGIAGILVSNPAGFIQRIAVIALIGMVIYLLFRRFNNSSPERKEQRAFLKAAKKSKKRLHQKNGDLQSRSASQGNLPLAKKKIKKKSSSHLTVIDGKKGKKKNRASF